MGETRYVSCKTLLETSVSKEEATLKWLLGGSGCKLDSSSRGYRQGTW